MPKTIHTVTIRRWKLLLSSDISVYAVGVGEANLNHGINILAKYAHSTGGDIFYASNRDDLGKNPCILRD